METISFEQLPQAVTRLCEDMAFVKKHLLNMSNEPQPETDELLTVQGAAKFLSLSVTTVYTLISKGELPVMKRSKRCYFSKVELINYLKQGRKKTLAETATEVDNYLTTKKR
jgi:excisionase family DNA binding protein